MAKHILYHLRGRPKYVTGLHGYNGTERPGLGVLASEAGTLLAIARTIASVGQLGSRLLAT